MEPNVSNKYKMTSEQNEKRFQQAFSNWITAVNNIDPDEAKNNWDIMWYSVQFACENIAKSIFTKRNVIIDNEELNEIIIDSTLYVMKFIQKGVHPDKLSSYCFLRVRRFIDEPKKVWYEKNITQFQQYDNGKEKEIIDNA